MAVSGYRLNPVLLACVFVTSAGTLAQTLPTAAKVLAAQGRVSVLRHREAWALFAGQDVKVGEIIETGIDGYAQLQVSDGSSFEVFPNSRVVFRANPGNLSELIEVFLGKVKVYIQQFGGRPNPYRVHSPSAVISVRGTVFEVGVHSDGVTSVSVLEGLVQVQHRIMPGGKPVQVGPGQFLQVYPNSPLAQSGVSKASIAAKVAGAIRDTIYSLPRTSGRSGGSGPSGGGAGGGLPTDTGAPPPPPTPTDREAPPPPPPPPQ